MNKSEIFHLLASADRQLVLDELVKREGEAALEELSRYVAARRHQLPPSKIDDNTAKRAQIRLVHTHIPNLTDQNIIEIDRDANEVALADEDRVEQLFEVANQLDSWPPDDLQPPYSSD